MTLKTILATTAIAAIATAASAGDLTGADRWAELTQQCLKRHSVLSEKAGDPGCYITSDYKVWCPSNVDHSIPNGCSAEANQKMMPGRFDGTHHDDPPPPRRHG